MNEQIKQCAIKSNINFVKLHDDEEDKAIISENNLDTFAKNLIIQFLEFTELINDNEIDLIKEYLSLEK